MNAQNLFLADGKPSPAWYCKKCAQVHANHEKAEACCRPAICEACGKEMFKAQYWHKCDKCQDAEHKARRIKKEVERYAAAVKLADFDGWVYCEELTGHSEGFFESLDELVGYCEDEGIEMPEYCWACNAIPFVHIDISNELQSIEENGYEDFDADDCKGLDELKAAVTAFNEMNVGTVKYEPDYTRAVVFPEELRTNNDTAAP